ncbi:MAG: LytTR family transcriptional regulator [Flavobacteriaceae bacterium]|nr:LytTR family transcriptional regulator [Flavobacteriaceae bacterium]
MQEQRTNNNSNNDSIYLKVSKKMVRVNFSNLLYIEGLSNYIKVYTLDKLLVVYERMSFLSENLPSNLFMRVHKSYIVNTTKIKLYTREYVEIEKNHIPLSATYRNDLISFLKS